MQKQQLKSGPHGGFSITPINLCTDSQGIILEASEDFLYATGKQISAIKGVSIIEIVSPASRKKIQELLNTGLDNVTTPINIVVKSGRKTISLTCMVSGVKNGKKGTSKYKWEASVNAKMLNRNSKKSSTANITPDNRYITFLENSSEGIWCIEVKGKVSIDQPFENILEYVAKNGYLTECNNTFARMYGYEQSSEMLGIRLPDMMPLNEPSNIAYLSAFVEAGYKMVDAESMELDKDGNKKYFLNNLIGIVEDGLLLRIWGTQRDITRQRNIEEALKESEERYKVFIQQSTEGIWRIEGVPGKLSEYTDEALINDIYEYATVVECNDAFAKTFGYQQASDVYGKKLDLLLPRTIPENISFLKQFIHAGFRAENIESHQVDINGQVVYTMNNLVGFVENDRLIRVWGTQSNITALKLAEKEASLQGKHYRTLSENVPGMIFRIDSEYRFTYVNRAVKETFNQPPDIFVGKTAFDLGLDQKKWDKLKTVGERVFSSGAADNLTFKIPSLSHPGKEYNLLLTLTPELGESGKVESVIAIANEISPLIKAQEELIYKDQLLSMITDVTNEFLKQDDFQSVVTRSIGRLCEVFNADSICIFENKKETGVDDTLVLTFDWKGNAEKQMEGEEKNLCIPFPLLQTVVGTAPLLSSKEILTKQFPESDFKEYLKKHSFTSLLVVPIMVQQSCWGYMFWKVKNHKHNWISVEKDMFEIFAISLGNALERKMAQQIVQESEARFRQLADNTPVMIWVADEMDRVFYVNKSFEEFTGLKASEATDEAWANLIHPDDHQVAIKEYSESFSKRERVLIEYRIRKQNGEYRWVIDEAIPRVLPDGTFLGYIGSFVDINDRKLVEEKIRFQARVMQEVSEAIIALDFNNVVITWNKGAENIYGIPAADIIGKPMGAFVEMHYINDSYKLSLEHLNKYNHWSGELYFDRRDGKRVYIHSAVTFLTDEKGNRIGYVGNNRDITDRRKSEEALRISEERYRSVVNAMGEGIMVYDKEGVVIASNKSAESILGISEEYRKGKLNFDYKFVAIHEDGTSFPPDQYPFRITQQTGRSLQGIVMGIYKPDGILTWISVNTEPVYYSDHRVSPDAVVSSFVDITHSKIAALELKQNMKQLRDYAESIDNILNSITDGFIAIDNDMKVLLWNRVFEKTTGIRAVEVIGRKATEIFPSLGAEYVSKIETALVEKKPLFLEFFSTRFDIWFEVSAFPSAQGLFIYFRDITKRKRQEMLLALEKEALEMNALHQVSLKNTTDFLISGLERAFPGMLCSVLVKQDDSNTLETLSAPSIPKAFSDAVNGINIGPNAGSCGTAMYIKNNVIVSDIENSELWVDFRDLALQNGLRSCWSYPIFSSQSLPLATFAIYHREVKEPSSEVFPVIDRMVNILRVIIENKQSEEKIKISNERYLLATMATNDAIWDADLIANTIYWGEGFHTLFGYKAGYFADFNGVWESYIHPQDKSRVVDGLSKFIESNSQHVWQDEYRFKRADGKYVLVSDRGFLIYNQLGKVSRMVGSMQDITEKREMEKKLLKQQLNKQKLVAQAVVDAQEKERSIIGKELHDNVNQILSTAKLYLEVAKSDDKERDNLIDMSTKSISDAINEIRAISRSLVPASIGDLGLVDSIQDLVDSIRLTRKLNVEFYHHDLIDSYLSEPLKLMLFRIAQEQVNNVIKHSQASNMIIELSADTESVNISISDNGKGFDQELVKQNKGLGLFNITSRAELFNGKVDILTAPGRGCTLNIHVPISSNL